MGAGLTARIARRVDAVIVSDVHCDGPGSPTQREFLRFLGAVRPRVLVLAGDVFHAFAAPRGVVFPAYRPVVEALGEQSLVVLPGNHDWLFPAVVGQPGGVDIGTTWRGRLGGLDAVVTHGDEVDRSAAYRGFHAVLRSRGFAVLLDRLGEDGAWRLLHRLAGPLGHGEPSARLVAGQRALAAVRAGEGAELVVMGHTHAPELTRVGAAWFLNPGDWLRHRTYGVVEGREVRLGKWETGEG